MAKLGDIRCILDNMENSFVNTNGTLDQKLMASLQGAKIPGADSRCLDEGISTLSAFIRVAKPNDTDTNYYMDININSVIPHYNETSIWIEPIDTLQVLYNQWYADNFAYIIGDINQDSTIDILDVVNLVNYVLYGNPNGLLFYLSDLNSDNSINIQDIILMINIIILEIN